MAHTDKAARTVLTRLVWDSESVHRANLVGGVMVQSFEDDVIGWILHVDESGHVYLNPRV